MKKLSLYCVKLVVIVLFLMDGNKLQGMNKDSLDKQLFRAVQLSDNPNEIENLIKQGVYIDSHNRNGNTPLILAARNGHSKNVEILLKRGAKPLKICWNTVENESFTGQYGTVRRVYYTYFFTHALNEASKNNHTNCIKALVQSGARPFKINKDYGIQLYNNNVGWHCVDENKAPINNLIKNNNQDCVRFLFDYAIEQDKKLNTIVSLSDYFKVLPQFLSYRKYVGDLTYKEYLEENIVFLLLVRKNTALKHVDRKLFLGDIVRKCLLNSFPALSEAIRVGQRSLGVASTEMKTICNEYTHKYAQDFPENRFIKYIELGYLDTLKLKAAQCTVF